MIYKEYNTTYLNIVLLIATNVRIIPKSEVIFLLLIPPLLPAGSAHSHPLLHNRWLLWRRLLHRLVPQRLPPGHLGQRRAARHVDLRGAADDVRQSYPGPARAQRRGLLGR